MAARTGYRDRIALKGQIDRTVNVTARKGQLRQKSWETERWDRRDRTIQPGKTFGENIQEGKPCQGAMTGL